MNDKFHTTKSIKEIANSMYYIMEQLVPQLIYFSSTYNSCQFRNSHRMQIREFGIRQERTSHFLKIHQKVMM